MKLKDYKYFAQPHDEFILKALKRLLKDMIFIGNQKMLPLMMLSNKDLIKKCYESRAGHRNENIFTNYIYWPGDAGLLGYSTYTTNLLWSSRVISIIGRKNITNIIKSFFIGAVNGVMSNINDSNKKEMMLLTSNLDVIEEAFKNVYCEGYKKRTKVFSNVLKKYDTSGLPF
jgi:hypothetical protein